jgi:molybdopterin-containing oxidoreductase family iron-sulfur binding subunit/carbon-monoxide dehydrogenase iron sulfur subunit
MAKTIFVDKNKCVGCFGCVVACKLQNKMPPYATNPPEGNPKGPSLMRVHEVGPTVDGDNVAYYFQPISCMHCLDAPCIKTCPRNALSKDEETNVTLVNRDKCIGCKLCLVSCPFGAPQFLDKKAFLCNLCIDRVPIEGDAGKTACEAICQARAIYVGDLDEISNKKGLAISSTMKLNSNK